MAELRSRKPGCVSVGPLHDSIVFLLGVSVREEILSPQVSWLTRKLKCRVGYSRGFSSVAYFTLFICSYNRLLDIRLFELPLI